MTMLCQILRLVFLPPFVLKQKAEPKSKTNSIRINALVCLALCRTHRLHYGLYVSDLILRYGKDGVFALSSDFCFSSRIHSASPTTFSFLFFISYVNCLFDFCSNGFPHFISVGMSLYRQT